MSDLQKKHCTQRAWAHVINKALWKRKRSQESLGLGRQGHPGQTGEQGDLGQTSGTRTSRTCLGHREISDRPGDWDVYDMSGDRDIQAVSVDREIQDRPGE